VRRIGNIKGDDASAGIQVRGTVKKNKLAAPFREAQFDIIYGEGISKESDLIELGVNNGIIEKSGTWFSYNDERLGQGRENVRQLLRERQELALEIEEKVRSLFTPADQDAAANNGAPEQSVSRSAPSAKGR
jgi:recombination protein RecA